MILSGSSLCVKITKSRSNEKNVIFLYWDQVHGLEYGGQIHGLGESGSR